jgi:hypothetical protein
MLARHFCTVLVAHPADKTPSGIATRMSQPDPVLATRQFFPGVIGPPAPMELSVGIAARNKTEVTMITSVKRFSVGTMVTT